MKLRSYQQAAVDAVYDHLRNRDDNPVAVLPTGAGKSVVLAKIASDAVTAMEWSRIDLGPRQRIAGTERRQGSPTVSRHSRSGCIQPA